MKMLVSDADIYREANDLLDELGDAAPDEASRRAVERMAAGDLVGHAVYCRIASAVEELLTAMPTQIRAIN
jgi:hypothetical protein